MPSKKQYADASVQMGKAREIYIINFFLCAALVGVSFAYNVLDRIPICPLCLLQVTIFYLIAIVSLITFVVLPKRVGQIIYGFFVVIFSGIGILAASRLVWMQGITNKSAYECAPNAIHYVYDLNFSKLFASFCKIYHPCVMENWSFLGMSMPLWSLICLCVIFLIGVISWFQR